MKNTIKRMSIILATVCVLVSVLAVSMSVMAQDVADTFKVSAKVDAAEVKIADGAFDVDITFENTPDLWAARLFVVYSKGITLAKEDGNVNVENTGKVFPTDAVLWSVADKSLEGNLMPELEKIVADNSIDVTKYHYAVVYCELESVEGSVNASDVFATLKFAFGKDTKHGDAYDVDLYYDAEADFIMHDGTDVAGLPAFKVYTPATEGADITAVCEHDYSDATCTAPKTCKLCGATEGAKLGHKYDNACDKSCNRCGATRTITHKYAAATCTKAKTCTVCKATTGKALGHSYKTTTTKATLTKNGSIVKKCTRCATVASNTAIKYAKTFTLSATSYTFDGKVKAPTVTVKDTAGKKLVKGTDYTVTYAAGRKNAGTYKVTITMIGKYSGTKVLTFKINPKNISTCTVKLGATSYVYNGKVKTPAVTVKNASGTTLVKGTAYTVTYAAGRTNVGTYKVTIKMKGNYTGTKVLTFKINPVAISLTKLTAGNKSFTAAWAPKTTVTGYEIQYSTAKNFSGAKTVTMTSKSTKTKTVKSLANGKKYYVRIRVYKTVNGVKLYSAWSAAKYVTPKAK